ncbi:MAG: class I SAM-dependent methyltransferase, partial [Actinomycetota bacterium]|nr:class I SAM-dependent methyltransferase [Actinomycetota bacterium]
DVLEHLPEPGLALKAVAELCRPGGAVVISVPNVANWQARLRLLRGVWRYEPTGLFDSGHLRFLTRDTLFELVEDGGLTVESCVPARLPHLGIQVPAVMRLPRALRFLLSRSWAVAGYGLALVRPTLFAYQLVCTARRPVSGGND